MEGILTRNVAVAGTIVQQPYEWGYQGMKDLARWSEGDQILRAGNGLIIVPTQIIDKSNVDGLISQQVKTWLGH